MSNWNFVIAAYGVTWATLIGYAFGLIRRRQRVLQQPEVKR